MRPTIDPTRSKTSVPPTLLRNLSGSTHAKGLSKVLLHGTSDWRGPCVVAMTACPTCTPVPRPRSAPASCCCSGSQSGCRIRGPSAAATSCSWARCTLRSRTAARGSDWSQIACMPRGTASWCAAGLPVGLGMRPLGQYLIGTPCPRHTLCCQMEVGTVVILRRCSLSVLSPLFLLPAVRRYPLGEVLAVGSRTAAQDGLLGRGLRAAAIQGRDGGVGVRPDGAICHHSALLLGIPSRRRRCRRGRRPALTLPPSLCAPSAFVLHASPSLLHTHRASRRGCLRRGLLGPPFFVPCQIPRGLTFVFGLARMSVQVCVRLLVWMCVGVRACPALWLGIMYAAVPIVDTHPLVPDQVKIGEGNVSRVLFQVGQSPFFDDADFWGCDHSRTVALCFFFSVAGSQCVAWYPVTGPGNGQAHLQRGGGFVALQFRVGTFAFQIDREISHVKFRVLCDFLAHQRYTLWTLAGGDTLNRGAPRNFPQRNLLPRI